MGPVRAYLEGMKHLAGEACALGVARRCNSHGKGGGQQLGMLGNQGAQAHSVLVAQARTILARFRGPAKWQQWLKLSALVPLVIECPPFQVGVVCQLGSFVPHILCDCSLRL